MTNKGALRLNLLGTDGLHYSNISGLNYIDLRGVPMPSPTLILMIKVPKLSVIWAKRNAPAKVSVGGFRLKAVSAEVRQNTES